MEEMTRKIVEIEERAKSNTHRINRLEKGYEKLDERQDATDITVIEIKKDTEKILEYSKESKERWEDFDKNKRKKTEVIKTEIIKWVIRIIVGIIVVALGIKKFII